MAIQTCTTLILCSNIIAISLIVIASRPCWCGRVPTVDPHHLRSVLSWQQPEMMGPAGLVEKELKVDGKGPTIKDLAHHTGYYNLSHSFGARMFYYFFESRNSKKLSDPVLIWLEGGPGCSSASALFYENGPFHFINNVSLSLKWNDFGWDKVSNIIYIDQPTGTGFSYTTNDDDDFRHDEQGISNDLYDFIQAFFKDHPEYVNNDLYIAGEEYAGHFVPAFASRIQQGNKAKQGIHINLKGIAIGNGLTNPGIQYAAIPDYAKKKGLINDSDYQRITKMIPACQNAVQLCAKKDDCSEADACIDIFRQTSSSIPDQSLNYLDIRKKCPENSVCYDFTQMLYLFLSDKARHELGVVGDFTICSLAVDWDLENDKIKNLAPSIPPLLDDGIKLLVYAGEYDLLYNWLGNSRWVHALEWSGKKAFAVARNVSFKVDGVEAGRLKTHRPLSFLKVHGAGQKVPMDQPKASLEMMRRWMHGQL